MRAGPTRVRCGMQGHVAEPRGPAQHTYVARFIFIVFILLLLYI